LSAWEEVLDIFFLELGAIVKVQEVIAVVRAVVSCEKEISPKKNVDLFSNV
jgi:hypothetical protein